MSDYTLTDTINIIIICTICSHSPPAGLGIPICAWLRGTEQLHLHTGLFLYLGSFPGTPSCCSYLSVAVFRNRKTPVSTGNNGASVVCPPVVTGTKLTERPAISFLLGTPPWPSSWHISVAVSVLLTVTF